MVTALETISYFSKKKTFTMTSSSSSSSPQIAIIGGGPVGLVLALALKKCVGVEAQIYEKVPQFQDNVGAGMGCYPNGLRVLRDLGLLATVREQGHAYQMRRIQRHDGTEVAVAEEAALLQDSPQEDAELESIGILRWRFLKVLYEAVLEAGLQVQFGKRLVTVKDDNDDNKINITFEDGTVVKADVVFAADGGKSNTRQAFAPEHKVEYTGTTCLMGIAPVPRELRGICFPSSETTKCHACYFPTLPEEQCFQLHFPIPAHQTNPGTWGELSDKVTQEECGKLADILRSDGWSDEYTKPLQHVTHAVRIGFCQLEPKLTKWVFGKHGRVVLLGDAAHPPVPYTGQGAQLGMEDAGTIALLLQKLCLDETGQLCLNNFVHAMKLYEKIRIPRAAEIVELSKGWGASQSKRAAKHSWNVAREEKIRRDVFFNQSISPLFPGVSHDYKEAIEAILRETPAHLSVVPE
jgi:salicylate hydroxylase